MTDLRLFALRVAALKVLSDRVEEELVAARADALKAMKAVGSDGSAVKLADGTKVAKVSVAGGNPSPCIADRQAFLDWVRENRPDEVEEKVRASFEKAVLDDAKKNGVIVPGVEFKNSTEYTACRFDPDGKDLLAAAWRDGVLNHLGALDRHAIEAGE